MRRTLTVFATVIAAAAGGALLAPPASATTVSHDAVVSENPVDYTPHVLNGRVHDIAVVGDTVIVGGRFSEVRAADGGPTLTLRNIFAFNAHTGEIEPRFAPRVDGAVEALTPGPDGTVFIGGRFAHWNGEPQRGLAAARVSTGRQVGSFTDAELGNGAVNALATHGKWLYVAGRFSHISGVTRHALARVNIDTGKIDHGFTMRVANPRKKALSVKDLALSPDGSQLVIDGNFTSVAGKRRYQIALINTAASPPRLENWATEAYTDPCGKRFYTYMRGVDFAPSGEYFVVVTTGGPFRTTMCDTAARWDPGVRGAGVQPDWVSDARGDSLYSVAITGAAVYVGGHQRWHSINRGDGRQGRDFVRRKGIAALDPADGEPLSWNPTRTRGHGAEALVATPYGLFVGSDTTRLGHEYHGRVGMFPVQSGNRKSPARDTSPQGDPRDGRGDGPQGDPGDRPQNELRFDRPDPREANVIRAPMRWLKTFMAGNPWGR